MKFITQLLQDIERGKKLQVPKQKNVEISSIDIGTVWLHSPSGSIIECYSWIDPAYCHGPLYMLEEMHMTRITFHMLHSMDRQYFMRWDDFVIYDPEQFLDLVCLLLNRGFQLKQTIAES